MGFGVPTDVGCMGAVLGCIAMFVFKVKQPQVHSTIRATGNQLGSMSCSVLELSCQLWALTKFSWAWLWVMFIASEIAFQ